jgi:hypothetical protein
MLKNTVLAALFTISTAAAYADTTIAYPTADAASFTITVPDDWELTPAEVEEDYFLVPSPSSVELWFRAMEITDGDEAAAVVEEAMTSGAEWLAEYYEEVELDEPTEGERDGMPFISVSGKGVANEGGEAVVFTIAFLFLKNGSMAEFWGILPVGDDEGRAAAQAVLDTFEAK